MKPTVSEECQAPDRPSEPGRSALLLHLQRLSTEDGPGIRTTVFFKGCPLHCLWCHNPESISPLPQIHWLENRCIGCETCLAACPAGCLSSTDQGININRARCQGCGACAAACPTNALELLGTRWDLDALLRVLLKDQTFYRTSGGGVTLSGGEPLMQPEAAAELCRRLQESDVHTALDTCGFCSPSALERVLPFTDLILFDLKEIDPERHRTFTGQGNRQIMNNLLLVRDYVRGAATTTQLWIRTPLIPAATDTQENMLGTGRWIARELDGAVTRWELCAFNNLCRDKYRRLGIPWDFADRPLLPENAVRQLTEWARQSGVNPDLVVATGAAHPVD